MMGMTNYMEILGSNQPWNMILFMLIPVGLAEALVATEFFCLVPSLLQVVELLPHFLKELRYKLCNELICGIKGEREMWFLLYFYTQT